jgi:DNA invertase Pin-like site-specific DNA recombinase
VKQAAIYLRVSTSKKDPSSEDTFLQNLDVQREPLEKLCLSRGWDIFKIYSDRMSGISTSRPSYKAMLQDARRGLFQAVVVWRFDRFARSVKELVSALDEFASLKVDFVSHQEAIDTATPLGKMTFTIIAAVAEMEREIIRERIRAGLDHAKAYGTKTGNPIGRKPAVFRRDRAREMKAEGKTVRQIADHFKVGVATVMRACSSKWAEIRADQGE